MECKNIQKKKIRKISMEYFGNISKSSDRFLVDQFGIFILSIEIGKELNTNYDCCTCFDGGKRALNKCLII